jgi:hypothetical protein
MTPNFKPLKLTAIVLGILILVVWLFIFLNETKPIQ